MARFWLKMLVVVAAVLISDRLFLTVPEAVPGAAGEPAWWLLALVLVGAAGWLVWALASMAGRFDRPRSRGRATGFGSGLGRRLGELFWLPRSAEEAGDA